MVQPLNIATRDGSGVAGEASHVLPLTRDNASLDYPRGFRQAVSKGAPEWRLRRTYSSRQR